MDPIKKLWMLEHWVQDQNDQTELAKNHAYLLGMFFNPEAVKKIIGDEDKKYELSDEEFEASTRLLLESREKELNLSKTKKRKKRKLKNSE